MKRHPPSQEQLQREALARARRIKHEQKWLMLSAAATIGILILIGLFGAKMGIRF